LSTESLNFLALTVAVLTSLQTHLSLFLQRHLSALICMMSICPLSFAVVFPYDVHILIGVTEARHNFHVPSEYNILPTDNLIPVYATIGDKNGGYGSVTIWKIDLLPVNGWLQLNKEHATVCDIGEVCFLKNYESYGSLEAGSGEWYVGGDFWEHVWGKMGIFMMSEG
jgi:hypothetical protein